MSGFKENEMIDKARFYIFDANNKMIGNVFGYKTHKAAEIQTNRRGYTVHAAIWRAYHEAKGKNQNHTLVHSIKNGGMLS
jgi:hypothetical protein